MKCHGCGRSQQELDAELSATHANYGLGYTGGFRDGDAEVLCGPCVVRRMRGES